ncbi:Uncharacterized conserved protein, contains FIST_N domain [Desulfuromusa kysingii]|uniref:Uncharacterized conserved protein, contains FIST_N domain n=1 Tax=Desulfuromusa kysingii TaxID=37625 RepID=A0A1H3ZRY3_9BACT|nr:FIST N-terminal domain-containing protein [Desulfuromusa kysingii]SEA26024.1 Uncharacterized conserved protein, contains FIST_N domain [Desulfuromusa kysingii]
MNVGIGYCNDRDAFGAGHSAATEAARKGGMTKPDLALVFCSGQLDPDEYVKGVKEVIGDTPIVGGSALGIITNDELSYKGAPSGVALLQSEQIKFQIVSADQLDVDTVAAGQNLAEQLVKSATDRLLLMFYDSVKTPASATSPPQMNASPALIAGIESVLSSAFPIIGAGVVADFQFSNTHQFCGDSIGQQSVVGALLSGDIHVYSSVIHGCSPIDGRYYQITKMDGANLYELDGKPIVDIIDELYGNQDWRNQFPLKLLTIGVNNAEKFQQNQQDESNYVNRLITGMLPDASGIGLFEPDLKEGMEIQFMLRDGNLMIESARDNSERLLKQIVAEGKTPVFGLYINCAGRSAEYSNTESEEAAEIQTTMNKYSVPLLGFYSGVEVAPIYGRNRGLDWTGVLMILAEDT